MGIQRLLVLTEIFFFFSSRRRHTSFDCDWSSDVCSSDLPACQPLAAPKPWIAPFLSTSTPTPLTCEPVSASTEGTCVSVVPDSVTKGLIWVFGSPPEQLSWMEKGTLSVVAPKPVKRVSGCVPSGTLMLSDTSVQVGLMGTRVTPEKTYCAASAPAIFISMYGPASWISPKIVLMGPVFMKSIVMVDFSPSGMVYEFVSVGRSLGIVPIPSIDMRNPIPGTLLG